MGPCVLVPRTLDGRLQVRKSSRVDTVDGSISVVLKSYYFILNLVMNQFQVAGKKGFPHVTYAKLFRWDETNKTELKVR